MTRLFYFFYLLPFLYFSKTFGVPGKNNRTEEIPLPCHVMFSLSLSFSEAPCTASFLLYFLTFSFCWLLLACINSEKFEKVQLRNFIINLFFYYIFGIVCQFPNKFCLILWKDFLQIKEIEDEEKNFISCT